MKGGVTSIGGIVKQLGIYSIGNILVALINFFLLPLYAHKFSIAEYGNLALYESTGQFLINALALGIPQAMLRWGSESKTQEELNKIISSSVLLILFINGLFMLAVVPVHGWLAGLLFGAEVNPWNVLIIAVYAVIEVFNQVPFTIYRMQHQPVTYGIFIVSKLLVTLGITLYTVIVMQLGVQGVLLGMLGGSVIFALLSSISVIKHFRFNLDRQTLATIINYGAPITLSILSSMILNIFDRFLLEHFRGSAEVGIYSLGLKLSGLISLFVIAPFQVGFLPIAYKAATQRNARDFFAVVFKYYTAMLVVASLFISLFSADILQVITSSNDDYTTAARVVPILAASVLFNGIQYYFLIGLRIVKISKYDAYVMLASLPVYFILNLLLVPVYGYMGCAVAITATFIFMTIAFYYYSNKHYPVQYPVLNLVKLLVLAIIMYLITLLFSSYSLVVVVFIKFALFLAFIAYLFAFKVVNKDDRQYFALNE